MTLMALGLACVGCLRAQELGGGPADELARLRERLHRLVDTELERAVRELRKSLHAAVDRALARAGARLQAAEDPGVAGVVAKTSHQPSGRELALLEQAWRRDTLAGAWELRLGVVAAPPSPELCYLHRLDPRRAARVVTVLTDGPGALVGLLPGDVVLGLDEGAERGLAELRFLRSRSGTRQHLPCRPWPVPGAPSEIGDVDPKSLPEEVLRRFLEQVAPRGRPLRTGSVRAGLGKFPKHRE